MNADIQAFAGQHGFDASAVTFVAEHVINTMTPDVLQSADESELIELVQAGVASAQDAHRRLAIKAHMEPQKQARAVYQVLQSR